MGKGAVRPKLRLDTSGVDWISGVSRTGGTDDGLIRLDFNFFHSWFRVFCVRRFMYSSFISRIRIGKDSNFMRNISGDERTKCSTRA